MANAKGSITSLPTGCVRRLDADGIVRGKTWRQMPGGINNRRTLQVLNWWLWKRDLLDLRTAKAEARAAADAERDMESGVAA